MACPPSPAADPQTTAINAGIYYGDVHVGTIAERVGNPHDTDLWEWSCGFYPGSHPREHQSDTAATFEQAAPISSARGWCFYRTAPRPIFGSVSV